MTTPLPYFPGSITEIDAGTDQLIAVEGDLDLLSGRALVKRVALSDTNDRRELLLDLAGVSFVDCAGLGALVSITLTARDRGQTVTIVSSSPPVDSLAARTGLSHFLPSTPPDRTAEQPSGDSADAPLLGERAA